MKNFKYLLSLPAICLAANVSTASLPERFADELKNAVQARGLGQDDPVQQQQNLTENQVVKFEAASEDEFNPNNKLWLAQAAGKHLYLVDWVSLTMVCKGFRDENFLKVLFSSIPNEQKLTPEWSYILSKVQGIKAIIPETLGMFTTLTWGNKYLRHFRGGDSVPTDEAMRLPVFSSLLPPQMVLDENNMTMDEVLNACRPTMQECYEAYCRAWNDPNQFDISREELNARSAETAGLAFLQADPQRLKAIFVASNTRTPSQLSMVIGNFRSYNAETMKAAFYHLCTSETLTQLVRSSGQTRQYLADLYEKIRSEERKPLRYHNDSLIIALNNVLMAPANITRSGEVGTDTPSESDDETLTFAQRRAFLERNLYRN